MKLNTFKEILAASDELSFVLPNGTLIPPHFHITEVGKFTKDFVDCGGTIRKEEVANFQIWSADDYDHRLEPKKVVEIIEVAENELQLKDLEIEVEYQSDTIGKYSLDYANGRFDLIAMQTDCLAKEKCGIPEKTILEDSKEGLSSCDSSSGCC
ncbi:MAG: hypothetical protein CMI27_05265 [Opitutae bacterium]|nr:hypothetical protein [Opitutae bacterium]